MTPCRPLTGLVRHEPAAEFGAQPIANRSANVYGDRNLVCSCVGMEAYAPNAAQPATT